MKPHLPALGPKLGKELGAVRAALAAGDFEQLEGGGFRVLGHDLGPDEVLVERSGKEGWAVASEEGVTVALDTTLDAELELEGRVYDLIHTLNGMRKEQGLELTDRITVTLPQADADLIDCTRSGSSARCSRSRSRPTASPSRRSPRSRTSAAASTADARGLPVVERGTTLLSTRRRDARVQAVRRVDRSGIPVLPVVRRAAAREARRVLHRHGRRGGKALRVSRYTDEGHVRFSVWDESGVAEAAVSIDDEEAQRLAAFLGVRERLRLAARPVARLAASAGLRRAPARGAARPAGGR